MPSKKRLVLPIGAAALVLAVIGIVALSRPADGPGSSSAEGAWTGLLFVSI